MKGSILLISVIGIIAIFNSNIIFAQTESSITAREIIIKNDQQRKAADEKLELTMKLINKKGKERVRKVIQFKKTNDNGQQKTLIRFLSPADVKGTGLLTIEHSDRDDDQWLYLPSLRKVRRISASNKSDNFVGTDFSYQDLKSEEMENYQYKLIKEEKINHTDCLVVEAVPNNDKEKKESGYSRRILWISKDNFVAIRIQYYNKKGELFKKFKATDIRLIDGTNKWRTHKIAMENLKKKHRTFLIYKNFLINKGIEDNVFTERYLKRRK
jgi:outer membrane lipoprotein-sorting protein